MTTETRLDETARYALALNERILGSTRQVANATLDAYERALETTTALTERVADAASHVEWISAATRAQAGLARDLSRAYVSSARTLLR